MIILKEKLRPFDFSNGLLDLAAYIAEKKFCYHECHEERN
jgi:hypothetical protein